jgi:hypothetical protein
MIPFVNLGYRSVRIREEDLERFLRSRTNGGNGDGGHSRRTTSSGQPRRSVAQRGMVHQVRELQAMHRVRPALWRSSGIERRMGSPCRSPRLGLTSCSSELQLEVSTALAKTDCMPIGKRFLMGVQPTLFDLYPANLPKDAQHIVPGAVSAFRSGDFERGRALDRRELARRTGLQSGCSPGAPRSSTRSAKGYGPTKSPSVLASHRWNALGTSSEPASPGPEVKGRPQTEWRATHQCTFQV